MEITLIAQRSRAAAGNREHLSSGRGGMGNIARTFKDDASSSMIPEEDLSIAPGRELHAANGTRTAGSTGRCGSGNIRSSAIVREANRVVNPSSNSLTAALVAEQAEAEKRYEKMIIMERKEAAQNQRHTYGRGGAGNSSSLGKGGLPKDTKPPERSGSRFRSPSRFLRSRSIHTFAQATAEEHVAGPEPAKLSGQPQHAQQSKWIRVPLAKTLLISRLRDSRDSGDLTSVCTRESSVSLSRLSTVTTVTASSHTSTPSLSASISTLSSASTASSGLYTNYYHPVQIPVATASLTSLPDSATITTNSLPRTVKDGDPALAVYRSPPEEDALGEHLARLQLRSSWKPRTRSLYSQGDTISLDDDWWEDVIEEGEGEDGGEGIPIHDS